MDRLSQPFSHAIVIVELDKVLKSYTNIKTTRCKPFWDSGLTSIVIDSVLHFKVLLSTFILQLKVVLNLINPNIHKSIVKLNLEVLLVDTCSCVFLTEL